MTRQAGGWVRSALNAARAAARPTRPIPYQLTEKGRGRGRENQD